MHTTIALTRFNETNRLVNQTLESLALQEEIHADVLFLDQRDDPELKSVCKKLSDKNIVFHYSQIDARGLSYARNQAIKRCQTEAILFIDADAIAHKRWALQLSDALIGKNAAVAGGKIIPKWHKNPSFLVNSSVVRDQYSLLNLGDGLYRVPKVVGTNLGINILKMGTEAYFDENMGRSGGNLVGRADMEICERALKNGHQVMYNGRAIVTHQVLPERLTYKWLFKRFYCGGQSKAKQVVKLHRTPSNPKNSWDYIAIPVFVFPYLFGYFTYKFMNKK